MLSLAAVYFTAIVCSAVFCGEYQRTSCYISLYLHLAYILGAYVVLTFTALYLLYVALDHSEYLDTAPHAPSLQPQRERTSINIVMAILTVVMFGLSTRCISHLRGNP